MRRRQDFCGWKKPYKIFLTESCLVLCPTNVVCESLFTNHRSESFSFELMNLGSAQSTFVGPTAEERFED